MWLVRILGASEEGRSPDSYEFKTFQGISSKLAHCPVSSAHKISPVAHASSIGSSLWEHESTLPKAIHDDEVSDWSSAFCIPLEPTGVVAALVQMIPQVGGSKESVEFIERLCSKISSSATTLFILRLLFHTRTCTPIQTHTHTLFVFDSPIITVDGSFIQVIS